MTTDFEIWAAELADKSCPDCSHERGNRQLCAVHRCRAVKKTGKPCKGMPTTNPMFCSFHSCRHVLRFANGERDIVYCPAQRQDGVPWCSEHAELHTVRPVGLVDSPQRAIDGLDRADDF